MRLQQLKIQTTARRDGYAMVMVLATIGILLSVYSVSHQHIVAVLRTESSRVQQQERDAGSVVAAARGIELLETGFPPTSPYACTTSVTTPSGSRDFTVTFSLTGNKAFSIAATPARPFDTSPTMPSSFAPSP